MTRSGCGGATIGAVQRQRNLSGLWADCYLVLGPRCCLLFPLSERESPRCSRIGRVHSITFHRALPDCPGCSPGPGPELDCLECFDSKPEAGATAPRRRIILSSITSVAPGSQASYFTIRWPLDGRAQTAWPRRQGHRTGFLVAAALTPSTTCCSYTRTGEAAGGAKLRCWVRQPAAAEQWVGWLRWAGSAVPPPRRLTFLFPWTSTCFATKPSRPVDALRCRPP